MNKVVYVKAYFQSGGEKGGPREGSDCLIDGARLSEDVRKAVAELNREGYEVIAVSEILSGAHHHRVDLYSVEDGAYGYGYGYSYTEGVMIIGKKMS
jgi:hypothetical protein